MSHQPLRVLHVLHHSMPYVDGYSIRSKAIVDAQRRLGFHPTIITSAHHESEVNRTDGSAPEREVLDGIACYRTAWPTGAITSASLRTPFIREQLLMRLLHRSLTALTDRHPVDLIHAHSPVLCGIPAHQVARSLGVPFVYEVRAFWEDAWLSGRNGVGTRAKYLYSRSLETQLIGRADAVVAIASGMVDDIVARGIPSDRVFHVPNGVDGARFRPRPRDESLAASLDLNGKGPVLGFIGSFYRFEGVDCLVRAMTAVLTRVPDARLLLVGAGDTWEEVRSLVSNLGLTGAVRMTGRVSHDDIQRYYSLIDVLVYPRRRDRVTELVTPLKPIEAMAMGKAVAASDVGGLTELIDGGAAGVVFTAGSSTALAEAVVPLLLDAHRRAQIAETGRQHVLATREWGVLARQYAVIYERVAKRRQDSR